MMSPESRFSALQERFRKAADAASNLRFALNYKYGEVYNAKRSERDKLDKLRERESKAADAIFAWLEANSPRNWRHGCPYYWICTELTYADAVTSGALSVVPPVCYGGSPQDSIRFARPVAA